MLMMGYFTKRRTALLSFKLFVINSLLKILKVQIRVRTKNGKYLEARLRVKFHIFKLIELVGCQAHTVKLLVFLGRLNYGLQVLGGHKVFNF